MIIPNLLETLRLPCPKSNKKECDQRNLNISDQFENYLVQPYTFWELEHDFYKKTSRRKFFYRLKEVHGLQLLRVEF